MPVLDVATIYPPPVACLILHQRDDPRSRAGDDQVVPPESARARQRPCMRGGCYHCLTLLLSWPRRLDNLALNRLKVL